MATKNFFSGVEGTQHFEAAMDAGATYCLMSYLYCQKLGASILSSRKKKYPRLRWLIDSGAHTFQVNAHDPKYASWTVATYEKYVEDYVKWLKTNKRHILYAVELDISYPLNICSGRPGNDSFGHEMVEKWRKIYFQPLLEEGLEIIFVFHEYKGLMGWEEMCKQYSYVGLPGEWSSNKDFNKYIAIAKRYSARIHGFAATKQSDFSTWPWFSIDSTTWKSGERYGTIIDWDERKQKLRVLEKPKRPLLRQKMIDNGFDAAAIIADTNYREVTRYTLFSMVAMENFYKNRFKDRVFYYELRLPVPSVIRRWKSKKVVRQWKKFDVKRVFPTRANDTLVTNMREYLLAISAVQNGQQLAIASHPFAQKFLEEFFPVEAPKSVWDLDAFKKEMASKIAPVNKAAQERTCAEEFIPINNPPKRRDEKEWHIEELEWFPSRFMHSKTISQYAISNT